MYAGGNLNAIGVATLGEFTDLLAAIGQHCQEAIFLIGIAVNLFLSYVKEIGRTLSG